MGEAEWMRLSERERQMKLLELKLKEKRLREQGLWDDAMDLLGSRKIMKCLVCNIK